MSRQRAGGWMWCAPGLALAFEACYLALGVDSAAGVDLLFSATFVIYAGVGALIASRHPRNPVGWLFCALGVFFAASEALHAYAREPADLPAQTWAAWLVAWGGEPFTVVLVLLALLFPTGRFVSRGWRRVAVTAVSASAIWALALALDPGPLRGLERQLNPVGVDAAGGPLEAIADVGPLILALCILIGISGAFVRYRRARGRERAQLKWIALAAGVVVAVLLVTLALFILVDTDEGAWDFVTALLICVGLAAFPVAAATAILRERLYDIDVVINRALVYGALTATLGATYLGIVLLAGLAVGESDAAVAVSTLAVAALFRPARARIQAGVDRRFYRRRYDAARTLEAFGARLRDELDLEALAADLRRVVGDTVQPAHVSLWLREAP